MYLQRFVRRVGRARIPLISSECQRLPGLAGAEAPAYETCPGLSTRAQAYETCPGLRLNV